MSNLYPILPTRTYFEKVEPFKKIHNHYWTQKTTNFPDSYHLLYFAAYSAKLEY